MNLKRSATAVLLGGLVAALLPSVALAQDEPASSTLAEQVLDDTVVLTEQEVRELMAAEIARSRSDIRDAEQAMQILEFQDDVYRVLDRVSRRFGEEVIAGAYFSEGEPLTATLMIKGAEPRGLGRLVARLTPEGASINLDAGWQFSLNEMHEMVDAVADRLRSDSTFSRSSLVLDNKSQTISIAVATASVPDAVQAEPMSRPAIRSEVLEHAHEVLEGAFGGVPIGTVSVVDETAMGRPEHAFGGAFLDFPSPNDPGCSTGFSMQIGNKRVMTTAAHCNFNIPITSGPIQYVDGKNHGAGSTHNVSVASYVQDVEGTWGDVRAFEISGKEKPRFFVNETSLVTVTGYATRWEMSVNGGNVCNWGHGNERLTCGEIVHTSCTNDGIGNLVGVRLHPLYASTPPVPGNSGGPWFLGSRAYGIHHGNCTPADGAAAGVEVEAFTPVSTLIWLWNATLLTG